MGKTPSWICGTTFQLQVDERSTVPDVIKQISEKIDMKPEKIVRAKMFKRFQSLNLDKFWLMLKYRARYLLDISTGWSWSGTTPRLTAILPRPVRTFPFWFLLNLWSNQVTPPKFATSAPKMNTSNRNIVWTSPFFPHFWGFFVSFCDVSLVIFGLWVVQWAGLRHRRLRKQVASHSLLVTPSCRTRGPCCRRLLGSNWPWSAAEHHCEIVLKFPSISVILTGIDCCYNSFEGDTRPQRAFGIATAWARPERHRFGWFVDLCKFDESLVDVRLPRNLQTLVFGENFNQSLEGVELQGSLQTLKFGERFNQSLAWVSLPSNLHALIFDNDFNQSLEGVTLPNMLQTLVLGKKFNQSLEAVMLPNSLQSLTFGEKINKDVAGMIFPSSLQTLVFGHDFQKSVEGTTLPSNLQSLKFDRRFDISLVGVALPSCLQTLVFGFHFNKGFEGVELPSSLQTLAFGYSFNQSLDAVQLPSSLLHLTFGTEFTQNLANMTLPSNL